MWETGKDLLPDVRLYECVRQPLNLLDSRFCALSLQVCVRALAYTAALSRAQGISALLRDIGNPDGPLPLLRAGSKITALPSLFQAEGGWAGPDVFHSKFPGVDPEQRLRRMYMENNNFAPMPTIGVDGLCIAELTADTKESCTYQDKIDLPGVTRISVTGSGEFGKFYADNGLYASYNNPSAKEVEFSAADISPATLAKMTGASYENGLLSSTSEDKAPKFALGYRRLRSDGSYRYVWLLKGSFRMGNEDSETKTDNVSFQVQPVRFVAENRIFDRRDRNQCDDNDPNLPETVDAAKIAAEWFKDPNAAFLKEVGA
ncbi:MAG: hypothetical protein HFJ80_06455 [Clostridiales bacterium]|nr:hypothetical protein [Clostridiales bacterium]